MRPLVQARDLRKTYQEGSSAHCVLDGVDLELRGGEMLALLGRSGSGKSTLLNLLAAIDRPDSGSIRLAGQSLEGLDERAGSLLRRRHIGFVFQFFNLLDSLSALENVSLPLEIAGIARAAARRRALEMLRRVGLEACAEAMPDRLSGGEKQRVAIARALVHEPGVLLADEPTGNLDAASGRQLLELLQGFVAADRGILVATHSLAVARAASRVLTLEAGRLIERDGEFAW